MQVYITQTGGRYHARTDLTCMENARGFIAVDLGVAVDGGLRPCLVCDAPPLPDSTEGDRRWLRTIDEWHRAGVFESIWEEAFARRILARMDELSADEVEPQAYINSGSDAFKVDFRIPRSHLVLEVDGYAKAGQAPTSVDLERRNRRDAALQAMGYTILHFTNAQVQDEPQACTAAIRAAVVGSAGISSKTPAAPLLRATTPPTAAAVSEATSPPPPPVESAAAADARPAKTATGRVIGLRVAVVALAGILAFAAVSALNNTSTDVPSPSTTVSGPAAVDSAPPPQDGPVWVLPATKYDCPPGFEFKANESGLVHPPDNEPYYGKTKPERCYETLTDAEADGYTLPPLYSGEWSG